MNPFHKAIAWAAFFCAPVWGLGWLVVALINHQLHGSG